MIVISLLVLIVCFMVFGVVDTLTLLFNLLIGSALLAAIALGVWSWYMIASI